MNRYKIDNGCIGKNKKKSSNKLKRKQFLKLCLTRNAMEQKIQAKKRHCIHNKKYIRLNIVDWDDLRSGENN